MDLAFLASDPAPVSQNKDYEVRDWCGILDCTPVELGETVGMVGSSAQAVRRFLDDQGGFCPIPSSFHGMRAPSIFPSASAN